jgi:LysR family cys regulon transcriptional activator
LNVSAAAAALFTSQPGISKQIGLLEAELGVTIFERSGKRLTGITAAGRVVLAMARGCLREAQNMKRVGEDFAAEGSGSLTIATTHTQARYTLPPVIRRFVQRYPAIRLHIQQGSPLAGRGLGARRQRRPRHRHRGPGSHPELVTLPCYPVVALVVVTPREHPLLADASR